MKPTKKKQPIDWATLALVITIILFVILIVLIIINKDEERKQLRERLEMLTNKKHQIEILQSSLDQYFKYAYNLIKTGCILLVGTGTYLIYESLPNKDVFEFAARFTDVVGALSLFVLLTCLFLEENPVCIFSMRSKIKELLRKAIYNQYKNQLDQLPVISSEIEEVKLQLDSE